MTEIVLGILYIGIHLFNTFFVIGIALAFIAFIIFLVYIVQTDPRMESESEVEENGN